jgi:hypothetical protein
MNGELQFSFGTVKPNQKWQKEHYLLLAMHLVSSLWWAHGHAGVTRKAWGGCTKLKYLKLH